MLVGATGTGKSTLVDGIINYILGVKFEDPFRFKMVVLEEEEKKNKSTYQVSNYTQFILQNRLTTFWFNNVQTYQYIMLNANRNRQFTFSHADKLTMQAMFYEKQKNKEDQINFVLELK